MNNIKTAIEYLKNNSHKMIEKGNNYAVQSVKMAIDALEVQLTNGWIPVSEKLPEESINGITNNFLPYNVSLKFEYGECTRTYKFGNGRWWNGGTDMTEYVIAWQPLPEPYKEVAE